MGKNFTWTKFSLKKLIALFIFTLKLMSQQQEQVNNRMMALPVEEVSFDDKAREEFLGVVTKFQSLNQVLKVVVDLINDGSSDQALRVLADRINWINQQIILYKILGIFTPIGRVPTAQLNPRLVQALKQNQPRVPIPDALKVGRYIFYSNDEIIPKMIREGTNNADLLTAENFPQVPRDEWNFIYRSGPIGNIIKEFIIPPKPELPPPRSPFAQAPIDDSDLFDVHQLIFKAGEKCSSLLNELRSDTVPDRYILNTLAVRVQDRFTRAHMNLAPYLSTEQSFAHTRDLDPVTEEETHHLVELAVAALKQLLVMTEGETVNHGLHQAIKDIWNTACNALAVMDRLWYIEDIPENIFDDLHMEEEEHVVQLETVSEQEEEEEPKEEKPVEGKYSMKGDKIIDAEVSVPKSESSSVSEAFEAAEKAEEMIEEEDADAEEEDEDDSKYRKLPFKFLYKINRNAYQRYSYTYNEILKRLDDIKKADPAKSAEVAILLSFLQRPVKNADELFKNTTLAIKFFRDKFQLKDRKVADRLMKLLFKLKSIAIEVSN